MNKASILHAPSWAHNGEFIAGGTIKMMAACIEGTPDITSDEGVVRLQNIRTLVEIDALADLTGAANEAKPIYLAYKWPTEDDYNNRNGLTAINMVAGEGVIGLQLIPGVRIQDYVGTDYTNASGIKMGSLAPGVTWSSVSYGDRMYINTSGQFNTTASVSKARAVFIEYKNDWVTYEII